MIDLYADDADDIVCKKSAQVGFSVYAILKSFHELKFEKRNILYALPTRNVVQDFVVPKVNPLISSNPLVAREMGSDSVSLKRLGDRFIYFKGGSEREAISVSVDTLVIDEYDRMPDMSVVTMFDSRLNAAEHPRRRRFSNPSSIGFGIDALYTDSDQRHWFVTCGACNFEWFIDYESDGKCHYVDKELAEYVCGSCKSVLTDDMRRNGRWVARFPSHKRHGYWMSQMIAPWVSAGRIIDQADEMAVEVFHAMVLGKAYTPSDMIVNRETILRACVPSHIPQVGVGMGVDQKASEFHWVAMTAQGMFAHGKEKSWEAIEALKLKWNAVVVADGRPYPTMPKRLSQKYPDFYVGLGKPIQTLDTVIWDKKTNTVYYDRVKILDIVADEITTAKLLFRENAYMLEDYIKDWENIYRTTVEEPDGRTKSDWLKKANKESDYSFATAYARIALSRVLVSSDSGMLLEAREPQGKATDTVLPDGRLESTLGGMIQNTLDQFGE